MISNPWSAVVVHPLSNQNTTNAVLSHGRGAEKRARGGCVLRRFSEAEPRGQCVPRQNLGTRGAGFPLVCGASARQSLAGSAFPGRAWERGARPGLTAATRAGYNAATF